MSIANQQNIDVQYIVQKLKPSADFLVKKMEIEEKKAELIYIKSVVNGTELQEIVIKPFFELPTTEYFKAYIQSLPQEKEVQSNEQLLLEITKGAILIHLNEELLLLDLRKVNNNTVLETNVEPTIQGPELALSEDIQTNLNLIRHRYHESSISIEMFEVGKKNHQTLAILYDQDTVNREVLNLVKTRVEKIENQLVLSSSQLQRILNDRKYSLFPTTIITERPDRIVHNLAGGKVILFLDGSPECIIAPVVFFDFMASMEDKYLPFWITKFTILLRYFGLLICLTLPGLYVAVTSFNPEILRVELALSVAGSRIGVPYPSFIEVLFLLIFMELLTEASIRLPKVVSATATTVGGLILGTAATEAALTSNVMIIIVSAVAIATFAIPINEMSFSVRIVRYFILLCSSIAGITGLILSILCIIQHLTNIDSFGQPYLRLFLKGKADETIGVKS